MAVLDGATLSSATHSYGGRVSVDLDDIDALWVPGASLIGASAYGALARVMAASSAARALDGYGMRSYVDDFYYRIHVVPASIDVGFLLGDSLREVIVWNAHFTPKTYSTFIGTGTDGITVVPPVAPPYNFEGLEERVFPFTLSVDGPPVIAAVYTWVIGGEVVKLRFTGERTVPFAFPPDWADAVSETLSWKTDIIESRDGTEQRVALRGKPRRTFEYRFQAVGRDWFRLQNTLWGWHRHTFAIPLWTDRATLTADAAAETSVLNLDTTSRGFTEGEQAILYYDANTYEVVSIASVGASSLTLARVTRGPWPMHTTVYPVAVGHLPNDVPVSKLTDNVAQGSVSLTVDPVRNDPRLPVAAAAVTYNGYEVLWDEPNWDGSLRYDSAQDFGLVDNGIGARAYQVTQTFSRTIRGYRWLLAGKAEIDAFRAFLKRRNGRQKALYIPTFSADMTLLEPALSGAINVRVDSPEMAALVGVNRAYERLVIEMLNGSRYYHAITGVTEDVDGSQIVGLSPATSTLIVPGNVRRMSFMPLYRLDSDEVVLNWVTDAVVTVEASFRLVTE